MCIHTVTYNTYLLHILALYICIHIHISPNMCCCCFFRLLSSKRRPTAMGSHRNLGTSNTRVSTEKKTEGDYKSFIHNQGVSPKWTV